MKLQVKYNYSINWFRKKASDSRTLSSSSCVSLCSSDQTSPPPPLTKKLDRTTHSSPTGRRSPPFLCLFLTSNLLPFSAQHDSTCILISDMVIKEAFVAPTYYHITTWCCYLLISVVIELICSVTPSSSSSEKHIGIQAQLKTRCYLIAQTYNYVSNFTDDGRSHHCQVKITCSKFVISIEEMLQKHFTSVCGFRDLC
ncbi:hypothetical protein P8452_44230 [Trifolium repens]|nr:hypothetical protein P8452_44230 [Trifolium repens]